jgi:hypothetical protein
MKKPNVPARPIIFSGPMVRALLEGRKTQTRRIVRPQPGLVHAGEPYWGSGGYRAWQYRGAIDPMKTGTLKPLRCPYGERGDLLWVRESIVHDDEFGTIFYPARQRPGSLGNASGRDYFTGHIPENWAPARRTIPAIHMPRWASRLTLRISLVRMEQVQDISRGDAMEEGCPFPNMAKGGSPRGWYAKQWDAIHGPGSWKSNPFVWVIGFEVIRQNVDAVLEAA